MSNYEKLINDALNYQYGEETIDEGWRDTLSKVALGGLLATTVPTETEAKPITNPPITQVENRNIIEKILDLVLRHEGLQPKQTPFRYTNKDMRRWDTIHGFEIDKKSKRPYERRNFIYLKNPGDVIKAVKKQFINYATTPEKYNLPKNTTFLQALQKFDQTGAKGKISFIKTELKKLGKTDTQVAELLNSPLSKLL